MTLVSLVTPVYDDPRVTRALASILAQTGDFDMESVVVDGGSGPETLRLLEEAAAGDPRISVRSEADDGLYDAMNKGVARASGDIIGILNADDRYADERVVADVVTTLRARPECVGCYGDVVLVDAADRVVRRWRSGRHARWKWHLGWSLPHPALFLRRSAYERFGTLDASWDLAADYELAFRIAFLAGAELAYLPRALVRMDAGGASNADLRAVLKGNREILDVWRRHGRPWALHVPLLKLARKLLQLR